MFSNFCINKVRNKFLVFFCIVNIKLKYNFVETSRNKPTIINLRGASTKLYFCTKICCSHVNVTVWLFKSPFVSEKLENKPDI